MTTSAYDSQFYKIAKLDQLAIGEERKFRAAGAEVLVRRSEAGVSAMEPKSKKALFARVENGEIWVCIEDCRES